jgi:hypothetical protein
MINIIAVALGIAIFLYALYFFWSGVRSATGIFSSWFYLLIVLIIFFLLGYICFEYILISNLEIVNLRFLISQVFLWGSVFVLITARLFADVVQQQHQVVTAGLVDVAASKKTVRELDEMNRFMVGRELDMVNLKKEVNGLLAELGREPKY